MADQKLHKSRPKSTTEDNFVPDVSEVLTDKKERREKKDRSDKERREKKERREERRERERSKVPSDVVVEKSEKKERRERSEKSEKKERKERSEKKSRKTETETETEPVQETVVSEQTETETEPVSVQFAEVDLTSKRRAIEREELEGYFDQYIKVLETELEQSRDNKNRKVNVRTWRLLLNEIKRLKTVSLRVMKKPKRRSENAQSGFMKPVKISDEMAQFAGWNTGDLKSRVDVTKYICNYIKENNLQNPTDRRQIVADEKLSRLLNYDQTSDNPLTYYLLQKKIQPHFVLNE
jgi:chromatin remodeling complex protein RSC6